MENNPSIPSKAAPNVDILSLFRMPWNISDNAFGWLEPTRSCDMDCEYCYQVHDPQSHKSTAEFEKEVRGLLSMRRCDGVIIAGGEPLTHPNIIEVVKITSSHKVKTLLLTNGNRLTPNLADQLKEAGLKGFIFHVDSHQNRPGWTGKTEGEINELRQRLTDMVFDAGGMFCGFNTAIVPSALEELKDIVAWVAANIHKVHLAVFIPVRVPRRDDPLEYFAGGEKVDLDSLPFIRRNSCRAMTAMELYTRILEVLPGFRFNSYLGGTLRAAVPKWLFGNTIGTPGKIYGTMGPESMEILQNGHHFITGRYLSFLSPRLYRTAQLLFPLALFDRDLMRSLLRRLVKGIRNPLRLCGPLYIQTLAVMQPHDILDNGEQDLCDGCPNKTWWNGRLISECRMEEHLRYGRLLTTARKRTEQEATR